MISTHRTAFESKTSNDALEHNLDKIVNMTSIKLKEMINKKQDKIREGSRFKAQKTVLESDIAYYENETKEKFEEINRIADEFAKTQLEIEELEKEDKNCVNEFNDETENYKETVNIVNEEYDSVFIMSGIEDTNKKSDMRVEYEKWLKMKEENKQLTYKMYQLRNELYYLEISYKKAADDEIQRIYKARKGIDTINKMGTLTLEEEYEEHEQNHQDQENVELEETK